MKKLFFNQTLKKLLTLFIFSIITIQPAYAAKLKNGFACISENYWKELNTASIKKDYNSLNYLEKNNLCIVTKLGTKVTILNYGWSGTAKVRAYLGDSSIILWTNIENVQR